MVGTSEKPALSKGIQIQIIFEYSAGSTELRRPDQSSVLSVVKKMMLSSFFRVFQTKTLFLN